MHLLIASGGLKTHGALTELMMTRVGISPVQRVYHLGKAVVYIKTQQATKRANNDMAQINNGVEATKGHFSGPLHI